MQLCKIISSRGTKEKDFIDEIRAAMRILKDSCGTQVLLRYCLNCTLSCSPKTLSPRTLNNLLPSNLLCRISSLCNSSCRSSSIFFSESYPLQEKPRLSNSSSGSCSVLCLGLYSHQKELSLGRSSSGSVSKCFFNPYLPIKNHFSVNYRCLTDASSNGTLIYGSVLASEVQSVANICSDQQKLEKRNNFPRKFVLEIVDILRNNGKDLDSRLSVLASRLSVYSITEIFELLNSQKISGLRFFEWIWSNKPQLRKNAYICSLIIDNIGRLDDCETMFAWLKKFTSEKICLTYKAFEFLTVLASTDSSLKESTKRVVDVLNKVGGSCCSSGVHALVEMFCKLDLFEMARYVIKITECKESYYRLMVREKCGRGHIEDAYSIIREMRGAHCALNTTVYNYLLGSLWKNGRMDEASVLLDEMKGAGISPDAITFEILINFVCTFGVMDDVHQMLDQMVSQGLEPRPETHACIIKTLFAAEKYEAAQKHVVDSSIIYKTSSNMMYSLMANLYLEKGDTMSARNILIEMMEKSLKPNFTIYIKTVRQLTRIGRTNLARDLERRHSKFMIKSHA